MEFSDRLTRGGIIIPNDNATSQGIRPRWGKVYAVGPDQKDVKVDEWVLVEHGRWTRGITMILDGEEITVRMIDNDNIIVISDEEMTDETLSTALIPQSDAHRLQGSLHNDGANMNDI